ncbi:MAG: hypothetical protein EU532_02830 [Promethearchaeota archaeon]|nr:MAG: hypothetical protein EU532_02830 [Candidatus Lokiarchaeota archaeon]
MNSNEFEDILFEKEKNGICTLTFNSPERRNALSNQTFSEIRTVLSEMERDKNAKVLIITGCREANAFSSGGYFDLKFFASHPTKKNNNESLVAISKDENQNKRNIKFWDFSKPIIAAINGLAIGAGITMILMGADLIYMADSPDTYLEFNFIKRAIIAQSAMSFILPFYVGFQKAKEILYFGEKINPQEAYDLRLVNKVLPPNELLTYVREQALKLIPPKGPSLSIKLMKKVMHDNFREIIIKTSDLEKGFNRLSFKTHDFREASRAFIEKREPNFKGR